MNEIKEVTTMDCGKTQPESRVSGIGVLALVGSGLFGGRARRDSTVLARFSQPVQPVEAMTYQEAA